VSDPLETSSLHRWRGGAALWWLRAGCGPAFSKSISPKARKYCQHPTISDARETFPGSLFDGVVYAGAMMGIGICQKNFCDGRNSQLMSQMCVNRHYTLAKSRVYGAQRKRCRAGQIGFDIKSLMVI